MLRKIVVVALGWAVGLLLVVQDAYPWPVTPERLTRGRAPLSLDGRWEGRLVRLKGRSGDERKGDFHRRRGVFTAFVTRADAEAVLVFSKAALALVPTEPPSIRLTGRVTRAPEEVVAHFGGLEFPGRVCVDATAPRFTWRSLAGLVAILWGAWILVRAIRRERTRKREATQAAFPGAASDAQPS